MVKALTVWETTKKDPRLKEPSKNNVGQRGGRCNRVKGLLQCTPIEGTMERFGGLG
jgi:hypothetical protein